MNKTTHPFVQLMMLMLFMVAMLFVGGIMNNLFAIPDGKGPGEAVEILRGVALLQLLSFALPTLIVVLIYYPVEWSEYLRVDLSGTSWLLGMMGVVVMLLLVPFTDWLGIWNDTLHLPTSMGDIEQALRRAGEESQRLSATLITEPSLPVSLFYVALVPAVCEELFFRAGVQNLLQRSLSRGRCGNKSTLAMHIAVWLSAAFFSLFHGEVFAFLPRLLMGALLGYLYVGSGSIVANILVHFANNAMVVALGWTWDNVGAGLDPSNSLALPWALTTACTLSAVTLFIVTFGKRLKISK